MRHSLNIEVVSSGCRFTFTNELGQVDPERWDDEASEDIYSAALLLRELLDNAQALLDGGGVLIPHREVVNLAEIDQQLLELPPRYPFDVRVDSKGTLNEGGFRYELGFYAHADGERLHAERIGCVLAVGESSYILSAEQLALCDAIDEFNGLPSSEKGMVVNLRSFAEIKTLSDASAAVLDRYLEAEDVIVPDKLELQLEREDDDLVVRPVVPGQEAFTGKFERFPSVRSTYTVDGKDGSRRRIVLSRDQQEALRVVKEHQRLAGTEKNAVLDDPSSLFSPDVFDLDNFSSRVAEIGLYRPRFYPFISPYRSEWIPGFVVETDSVERQRVRFESEDDLREFEQARDQAATNDSEFVSWKSLDVPVADADRIIETSRRQFANPSTPVASGENATAQKVLIIRENIDDLDYAEVPAVPTPEAFVHKYQVPPFLRPEIRPRSHQEEGIAWLQSLCREYTGALLADDMGLGKTLVVLAFLKWHAALPANKTKPYLIVAPVSLLENWENEYKKFFEPSPPPVIRAYGETLRNMTAMADGDNPNVVLADRLREAHFCLTTYETMRQKQFAFGAVDWAVVVLDEAQKIKTPGTLVTNSAKALKADFKIAMTGTPVENSLVDLWCIMDFVTPGLLGSAKEFAGTYQNRLDDPDVDVHELGEQLRERLGVYIKRRLKKDVTKELPEKRVCVRARRMPPVQRDRYLLEIEFVEEARANAQNAGTEVLKALHAMRAISDHPYLVDRQLDSIAIEELIDTSAKLQETAQLLRAIKDRGEKAILFAERRETQRLLARLLLERFGISASIINGDTPAGKRSAKSSKLSRQQTIDQFEREDGFGAIIMSPLAAGVGLNVTAANHVIHYSRHWNPAKEDQATDRAYRIGQEKDVYVYYPMATLEEFDAFDVILDKLLCRKRKLAEASLFPTERVEVRPDDLYGAVFAGGKVSSGDSRPLGREEVDTLAPHLFEAYVAALWRKQGYDVQLTPQGRDRGADVVATGSSRSVLLQVKHSSGTVGITAVQEIAAARAYYSRLYALHFELGIVTNGRLTNDARQLARDNDVRVQDGSNLYRLVDQYPVTLAEVRRQEAQRMQGV